MRGWNFALGLLFWASHAAAQDFDTPRTSDAEDEERLRGDELRRDLPDVQFELGLPVVRAIPALNIIFPYQAIGVGMNLELVPLPWLRASVLYSFGVLPADRALATSHYGEALLGVRLFGVEAESAVDIPLGQPRPAWKHPVPVLKAWVPAYHALFVEAGMLTGFTALDRCKGGCVTASGSELPSERRQIFAPMAGVRYAYAYEVRSRRRDLQRRMLIEVYAHLFAPPVVAPRSDRFFPNGDAAGPAGFGGRVGVDVPPLGCLAQIVFGSGCLSGDVSVGYAPYPRFVYFHAQVGYPFY